MASECTEGVPDEGGPIEERALVIPGREDEEVARALDRMRKNFYHLWLVLEELCLAEDPDALLCGWGGSP